ncbi:MULTISPECIES: SH3 domain-containing protein [unclassified Yoonia]|uniref:SH3 domain-containing protein n=1 Tax=unclassified Yoonia TaxID=2629118 RepID=UPI002AFE7ADE|nr:MULTISPECIES: SH3 domain-containing protein [unclassified Yoonia]
MRLLLMLTLTIWPFWAVADAKPPILPALYEVLGVAPDDQLNIRAAPDAGSDIIGALAFDRTAVEVIAFSIEGGWALVNHGERSGWVAARFLQRSATIPGPLGFSTRNLTCYGTEPFWSMQITDTDVQLSTTEGTAIYPITDAYFAREQRFFGTNTAFFDWVANTVPVRSHILPGICYDGMSDQAFGLHYIDDAFGHKGCCSLY